MTNLAYYKSRDITLPIQLHIVKAMVFPVVMYECEIWTIMKTEAQRIYAFELWCWRRFLRVLWAVRRSKQSIPKEINPEYLLEGLMLKWNLQYFGHLMQRADSLERTDVRKDWKQKVKGTLEDELFGQHHWLSGHELEQTLGDNEGQGSLKCYSPWGCKEVDTT